MQNGADVSEADGNDFHLAVVHVWVRVNGRKGCPTALQVLRAISPWEVPVDVCPKRESVS